jgi:hypothetical protein
MMAVDVFCGDFSVYPYNTKKADIMPHLKVAPVM